MPTYVITRHDSRADGSGRLPAILMGAVQSPDHRAAVDFAHGQFVRSECQWVDAVKADKVKRSTFNRAMEIGVYVQCPDCGIVLVRPTVFLHVVGVAGLCPTCNAQLYFEE